MRFVLFIGLQWKQNYRDIYIFFRWLYKSTFCFILQLQSEEYKSIEHLKLDVILFSFSVWKTMSISPVLFCFHLHHIWLILYFMKQRFKIHHLDTFIYLANALIISKVTSVETIYEDYIFWNHCFLLLFFSIYSIYGKKKK